MKGNLRMYNKYRYIYTTVVPEETDGKEEKW